MRTLQVAEFDDGHRRIGWASSRTFGGAFQFGSGGSEGVGTKGNHVSFAYDGILTVRRYEEGEQLLSLFAAHQHGNFGDRWVARWFNRLHLPGQRAVITEHMLDEGGEKQAEQQRAV